MDFAVTGKKIKADSIPIQGQSIKPNQPLPPKKSVSSKPAQPIKSKPSLPSSKVQPSKATKVQQPQKQTVKAEKK